MSIVKKSMIMVIFVFMPVYTQFKLGIENIPKSLIKKLCKKKNDGGSIRIGLVTNQTGVDQKGRRTIDILKDHTLHINVILVPEHGLDGNIVAGTSVDDSRDQSNGIPVVSLYGNGSGKRIDKNVIDQVDLFMFDIQDSGMRHYTYISTLFQLLEAAGQYKKDVIVFDRPNLLGRCMEGPLVDENLISFVSIAPIPLRHGMTVGELAHYFSKKMIKDPPQLLVVKMNDYKYNNRLKLDAALSPNIQTMQSVYGYSFLGLLGEIKPIDVGVGTPHAFCLIGLPRILRINDDTWNNVQELLKSFGVQSTKHSYVRGNNRIQHDGLLLHFNAINRVRSFDLFVALVDLFYSCNIPLNFSPLFNKAIGTADVQSSFFEKNRCLIGEKINENLHSFFVSARSSFLYKPLPVIHYFPMNIGVG